LAIFLAGSVLAFLGLRGADEALPLLRRSNVRESLGERGLREAAIRRLRTSRSEYDNLVWQLTLLSMGTGSALGLGLLLRATSLAWWLAAGALLAGWLLLLLLSPLVRRSIDRLPVARLVVWGVMIQMLLWLLLPFERMSRIGLLLARPEPEANGTANGSMAGGEASEAALQVEEEIADEPLEHHERAMIHAILHLDETPVREIMVPRVDMVSLDVSTTLDDAVPLLLDSGHSRLPLYEDSPDNIVGILYSRDLLAATAKGGAALGGLRDLSRPCFFVPESKRVDEMLREFQERRVHLAVVVDEYGGVAGIVTIEDLLEEIVGEIEDEFDTEEQSIEWGTAGEAVVDARMPIDRFNEEFGSAISPDGFDTLGGYLFSKLGRMPAAGDLVAGAGLNLQVVNTVGRRIKKVRVERAPEATEAAAGPAPEV
jgi:CBS domain containing-hemolysin-like protein